MSLRFKKSSFRRSRRRVSKNPLFKGSISLGSISYLHPYMDSASWLYMDPSPATKITTPVMYPQDLQYALPLPKRKINCSKRHHHHHRRVVSDPGSRNWNIASPPEVEKHRRISSFNKDTDIYLDEAMTDRYQECFMNEYARTSTFRKVPWHPNLHMLKIRQT